MTTVLTALAAVLKGKRKVARTEVLATGTYTNADIYSDPISTPSGHVTFFVQAENWNNPYDSPGGTQMLAMEIQTRASANDPWTPGPKNPAPNDGGKTEQFYGGTAPATGQARLGLHIFGTLQVTAQGEDGDTAPI